MMLPVSLLLVTGVGSPQAGPKPAGTAPVKPPSAAAAAMQSEIKRASAVFDHAVALQRAGNYAEAKSAYAKFLGLLTMFRLSPRAGYPAHVNLARMYRMQNNLVAEQHELRVALQIVPGDAASLVELSTSLLATGHDAEAEKLARRVLRMRPPAAVSAPAHFVLGSLAARRKQAAVAEREFALSNRLAPGNADVEYNQAVALTRAGKFDKALATITGVTQRSPRNTRAQLLRAALLLQMARAPEAVGLYTDILKREPNNVEALEGQAQSFERMGNADEAISSLLNVVRVAPNNVAAHLALGNLYYSVKNYQEAKAHFDRAVVLNPADAKAKVAAAYATAEQAYVAPDPATRNSLLAAAESQFKAGIAADPKDVAAQDGLAKLYERTMRPDDALAIYRKQQQAAPDKPDSYYKMARTFMMKRDVDGVLGVWKQYRAIKPSDVVSYQQSASILEAVSRYSDAVDQWKLFLAIKPKDGNALLAVANDYERMGNNGEARKTLDVLLSPEVTGSAANLPFSAGVPRAAARDLRVSAFRTLATIAAIESKPQEQVDWLTQAERLVVADYAERHSPPPSEVYRDPVQVLERIGKPDDAAALCDQWAAERPADPEPLRELGSIRESQGRLDLAEAAYRKSAALDPKDTQASVKLAEMFRRHGALDKAAAEYQAVYKLTPGDATVAGSLAGVYEQAGRYADAVALLQSLTKGDPRAIWVTDRLATDLTKLKRFPEARALLESELVSTPNNAQVYADLANLYGLEGRRAAYLPWLQQRYEKAPNSRALMGAIADEFEAGKNAAGGWAYLETVAARPSSPADTQQILATTMMERGHKDQALALFRQLAAAHPTDTRIRTSAAGALYGAGARQDAVALLQETAARADIPLVQRVQLYRQVAGWQQEMGAADAAAATYRTILGLNADDVSAATLLADLYQSQGKDADAVTVLTVASQRPKLASYLHAALIARIGAVYEKQNKKPEAIQQYREALRIDAGCTAATEGLKRLGGASA